MARKRLCKVVDLTSVKIRGQAAVAENYVYDGDQLVAAMKATGAIQYEYFDGSSLDQAFADQTVLIGVFLPLEDLTGAVRDVISAAGVLLDHRKIYSIWVPQRSREQRYAKIFTSHIFNPSAVCGNSRIVRLTDGQ